MKNLIVLAVATLFATNAVAAEMKWNGSVGWRYSQTSLNDSLDSVNNTTANKDVSTTKSRAHAMRGNLGVMGGWEHVEYGVGVRTGGAGTKNSDYGNPNQGGDVGVGIEQAWARYVRDFGSLDLGVTVGRQKNALVYDNQWETLFDNDVRWDGFGWNFKFGMFGLNAAQYVLGAVTHSPSTAAGGVGSTGSIGASNYNYTEASEAVASSTKHFAMLYAFQPHMNWKFSDEIEAMFAVAYYRWVYEGDSNRIGGGVSTAALANTAGTKPALATGLYKMENNTQWDFLVNLSLPMNFALVADYVKANKAAYSDTSVSGYGGPSTEVGSSAWTLGLTYGKLRKAQDFSLGYAYTTKGIASVINTFGNSEFAADNKGHTVTAGYAMADNFHLGFKWMNLQEKERISTVGTATANGNAGSTYNQSATNVAGQNSNQKMKTNYWELTAGVAF